MQYKNNMESLGILFGASGHGRASAHYASDRIAINLTRSKGDGCVSHELAHYIDNMIAKKFPKDNVSEKRHAIYGSFTKGDARNISNSEIYIAMRGLMHFIKNGVAINKDSQLTNVYDKVFNQISFNTRIFPYVSEELNVALKPLFEDFVKEVVNLEIIIDVKMSKDRTVAKTNLGNAETIEDALVFARQKYPTYFNYVEYTSDKRIKVYFEALLNTYKVETYKIAFKNNPIKKYALANNYNTSTTYYMRSSAMSSDYWTFDWELFARGFETYIAQKQMRLGRENNYLVSGAYFDRPEGVYPAGIERDILYILYENLFSVIKKELSIKDFVPFREERVNEYILLGDNDTEKKKVVTDTLTEEVINEEKVKVKLKSDWGKILEKLSAKKSFEEGGEVGSGDYIGSLFKYATATA